MRSYTGYSCRQVRWGLALCIAFSSSVFAMQASPQSEVPTPTQFQSMVPENATIQYSRNVSGNAAVEALASKLGIHASALAQVLGSNLKNLGPDPLGTTSKSKTATWLHTEQVSAKQVLSGSRSDDSMRPMAVGDTYTTHWSSGGWNYSATYTWNGQGWELTSYAATKAAPRQ